MRGSPMLPVSSANRFGCFDSPYILTSGSFRPKSKYPIYTRDRVCPDTHYNGINNTEHMSHAAQSVVFGLPGRDSHKTAATSSKMRNIVYA